MSQEVKYIDISELVLWSENPRDSIDENATDQDIVDRALADNNSKWTLPKLAKEMGDYYDLSELPTVVYHKKKPVVYDGNRRIILGKIKHGLVKIDDDRKIELPDFPAKIPCNVCTEEIAINNVFRKHGDSGSWSVLDRDIFLHKFKKQPKSTFLKLEDNTGIISANPYLNRDFVKREILTTHNLNEMGFDFDEDTLVSKHSDDEAKLIFENISSQVALKNITTRRNRGQITSLLEKDSRDIIEKNKNKSIAENNVNFNPIVKVKPSRRASRTKPKEIEIFGETLYLKHGEVNDVYLDILDLYKYYVGNKQNLSHSFPSLIRMSLRLLCESASNNGDGKSSMETYIKTHFANAKKTLDTDVKTTLSNHNVHENTLLQLLHTGAHNYKASKNLDQTLAVSIILGSILKLSHGKK